MKLEKNITIYGNMLQDLVDYVNNGWEKNYKVSDVVGVEWGRTYLFVHFNKEDFTKDAYPVNFMLTLITTSDNTVEKMAEQYFTLTAAEKDRFLRLTDNQ